MGISIFFSSILCLRLEGLAVVANTPHALEVLSTIDKSALVVGTRVNKVGVEERKLDGAVDNSINSLNTLHERVVLVTNLVTPSTEATTRVDVHVLKLGKELLKDTLTLERRSRVTVIELAVVGRDNLVLGLEHLSVDKTLDTVLEEVVSVNRLHGRLRNLEHDAPVRTLVQTSALRSGAVGKLHGGQLLGSNGLVVRRVVGEDGGAVEGAVVLGEVKPALVADALGAVTADTNTDNVGAAVEETLGELVKVVVAHGLGEEVDRHGRDELAVLDGGTILESNGVGIGVNLGDSGVRAVHGLLLGKSVGDGNPDTTSTTLGREAESGIGAPVAGSLVQDDVLGDSLEVGSSDTLTEPLALHLGGGNGPDLVVVGTHEEVGNTLTHHSDDPLVKVLGLGVGDSGLHGGINHAVNALDLLFLGKHGDVVLEGVGDPLLLAANVGYSLSSKYFAGSMPFCRSQASYSRSPQG
ncbi:Udp-Galactopyranose mutase in complex with Udp, partial [Aureobasidium melanogenum]